MIHIITNCLDPREEDLKTYGRVVRGLENLKKSGYAVHRFDFFDESGRFSNKKAFLIEHTSRVDNSGYEAWLQDIQARAMKKPDGEEAGACGSSPSST